MPNASHSLDKSDALETVQAFYASVVKGTPRPEFTWTFEKDGAIKVVSKERPEAVTLWQATNPDARNFRLDVIGPAYQSTVLTPSGPNTWVARVQGAGEGMDGVLRRADLPDRRAKYPLKFTTAVRVLPDTLPFAAPVPKRPSECPRRASCRVRA